MLTSETLKKVREVEAIAAAQFEYVGDEGLFPNHTDKDIWIAGFVQGYFYFKTKNFEISKSPGIV